MPHSPLITEDLPIVPSLKRLIPKEVNRRIIHTRPTRKRLLCLHMLQTIRLIPPMREDIKAELPTNAIRKTIVRKLLLENIDEIPPNIMHLVIIHKLIPLRKRRIPPNRRNVHHAIPKLYKRPPLDRNIQVCHIPEHEIHKLFVFVLAEPADEAGAGKGLAETVGYESVFGKTEIEEGGYGDVGCAELFLLFCEVGAADVADGAFVAELGEEGEHGGGCLLEEGGRNFS